MATTVESIQQLYLAYFNRPADAAGLDFWAKSVAAGTSLATISATFAATPEYKATFNGLSNDQVVNQIYQNLFNRKPDAGGLKYWSDLLTNKVLTIDNVVAQVTASALQDPAKGADTVAVQSKIAAAVKFTDYLNTNVDARVAYSSGAVNQLGRDYLAGVTDATTLASTLAALPTTTSAAIITGGQPVGTTYTLTTGPDTVVGTASNDIFNANENPSGPAATLTGLDSIDGGAGNDTLNVVSVSAISIPTSLTVKNIENTKLVSAAGIDGDVSAWTGLTQVTSASVGTTALTAATSTNVSATVATTAGDDVTVTGGKAVTINASGVTTGGTITATGATGAVNITTTEKASQTTATASDINVKGGSTVTITANLKGAVAETITGGAIGVTGTSDTTTVSVTQTAAATAAAKVSGVVDGAVTIADANAGSATKAATITTVSLANYGDSTISSNALTNLTLSGKSGTLGITSGLTKETVTTLNLTVNGLSGTNTITDASNHFKTINLTTTGKDSTIANIVDSAATALKVAGDHAVTFTSVAGLTKLATVTVSGSAGLTADVSGLATVTGVDASATSGDNTITIDGTKATYTGGSGVDTVILTADPTKAIDGGAGSADELVINIDAATALSDVTSNTKITGFEVLGLGAAADGVYEAAGFTGLHIAGAVAGDVTFANVSAGATLALDDAPTAAVTYSLKTNTAADALTLSLGTADTDGVDFSGKAITLTSIESVTINSLGSNEDGSFINKAAITDATATSLTIAGTEGITVTGFAGATLKNIDVSGIGADLAVDLTGVTLAAAGVTFKGGDGNYSLTDTNLAAGKVLTITAGDGDNTFINSSATGKSVITLGNGDNAVTLTGTTGVDTVTVGSGENTITLGSGASIVTLAVDTDDTDTVVVGTPATANNYATITGLTTDDVLSFADQGTEVWLGGSTTTGQDAKIVLDTSTALFADYIAAATAGDGSTNGIYSWFQFQGNTYVVEDKSADVGFKAGDDIIVKLTGLVDLSKATVGDHIITLA
ncbi:DUF4214 domain-containing protein [Pseudoduganella sp. FT55W]|uniref:DUF4214 domain-containing protein n=1 Tax=Duganella rivi TaxID=2666083 RepID=A0A7X4GSE1_9BURK|nr:DUF4214 domain-containing protein [Duganella rivi]MYM68820.1 DUF4214 domain-containing protein [Duganella rivi]